MNNYKIVAVDLDGTLLNNNSHVSAENLDAIRKLTRKGCYLVPSTGRTLDEMPEVANIKDIRYIIHSNGSVIYDKHTNKQIKMCFSKEDSGLILDKLYSCDCHITIRHNGKSLADALCQNDECRKYNNVLNLHGNVIDEFGTLVDDFKNYSYSLEDIEVISVFFHNNNDLIDCMRCFKESGRFNVVSICPSNLEIFSVKAGKGNAIKRLAEMLDINIEDTIGVGDSENDVSIINSSGLGLAVSNASDVLKSVADDIICSNEEHIVKYILKHYFK